MPSDLLDYSDYPQMRKLLFDRTAQAVQKAFPVSNDRFTMSVSDVHYKGPEHYSRSDEKEAKLRGKSLTRRLVGTWAVTDNETGKVVSRSKPRTIINVPYITGNGTFIRNGVEYTIAKQFRLRPGVYTRITNDGRTESQFNAQPRTGTSFRVFIDPGSSVFYMKHGGNKIPLYPILKSMGVQDSVMRERWGKQIFSANQVMENKPHAIAWLNKFAPLPKDSELRKEALELDEKRRQNLLEHFNKLRFDPTITEMTLGKPYDRATPDAILDSTAKILKVSRREADIDDRDSLLFQTIHDVSDFLGEKIRNDQNGHVRKLLWKVTGKNGDTEKIPPSIMDRHVQHLFDNSGLAQAIEEINPLDPFDQNQRILRMGEGALSSVDVIPMEARNVNPSYLGFVDAVRAPESLKVGVDMRLARNVRKGPGNILYSRFVLYDGKPQWVDQQTAARSIIGFADSRGDPSRYVPAMIRGRVGYVDKDKIDFYVENGDDEFSYGSNLVPYKSGDKPMRLLMGSKYAPAALPLVKREAPLVRTTDPDHGSTEEFVGKFLGAIRAEQGGVVKGVYKDHIKVEHDDGSTAHYDMYVNYPFSRKSVAGSSRIYVRKHDGTLWCGRIEDYEFAQGDQTVSYDPVSKKSAWQPITGFVEIPLGNKQLLQIKTRSGRQVVLTEDHSLVTLDEEGELVPVLPGECKIGTKLPVAAVPSTDEEGFGYAQGVLDGLYLAEGHVPPSQPNLVIIACAPKERQEQLLSFLQEQKYAAFANGGSVCFTDKTMAKRLREKFGHLSHNKRIPECVLQAPVSYRKGLLNGYFAGDGCALQADVRNTEALEAFTVSEKLRNGLVDVLATFGVFCTLPVRKLSEAYTEWRDVFGLRVRTTDMDKLERWYFFEDREEKRRRNYKKQPRSTVYDNVPTYKQTRTQGHNNPWRVGQVLRACKGETLEPYEMKVVNEREHLPKWRMLEWGGVFGDWARSDITWDEIVSIAEVPPQDFVYDLCVQDAEVFAVDHGLLVHNTFIRNMPLVKAGARVKPGQMLASSNFTNDEGLAALGTNLKTAYATYHGKNFEDAIVVSESTAKKMTSEHLYKEALEKDDDLTVDKKKFFRLFPGRFDKEQLKTIDPKIGIAKPGTQLKYGDPVILAVREREPSKMTMGRRRHSDASIIWDHHFPATVTSVVTDVVAGKKNYSAYVRANVPLEVGDKLSSRHGAKGVVSEIVPDEKMMKDKNGEPFDIILAPEGLLSRTNPAQLIETQLGKVAVKTGIPYTIPGFAKESGWEFVQEELRKHRLKAQEEIYDPVLNKKIPDVFTGNQYFYKLQQTAEGKAKSRSTGRYTAEEQPARGAGSGSKHIGDMELQSLLSHGADAVIKDLKIIKGQKNDDFWRQLKLGHTPTMPGTPLVYEKFRDLIRAAGIDLREGEGDYDNIFAMSNKRVHELTGNRRIETTATYKADDMSPMPGGLFDPKATGADNKGDRWSYIQLPESMLNPIMYEPVRLLLGLKRKELDSILSGKTSVGGQYGGDALKTMLSSVDLDSVKRRAVDEIKHGAKSKRDAAVKRYQYAAALEKQKLRPEDFLWDRVPVLPPRFRPIFRMNKQTIVSDPNYLYKALMDSITDFKEAEEEKLPLAQQQDARDRMNKNLKALIGLGDPVQGELRNKRVGGILSQLLGKGSPKGSFVQRRVIGTNIDVTGLSVIVPNPSLKLNEVGLPETRAWDLYEPFIVRHLVRKGVPAVVAAKAVRDKNKAAYAALQAVVKERPVLINRAPTLHKYSILAAWPRLTKGHTLQIPPAITSPFNADFDGNCCVFDSEINLLLPKSALDKEYFSNSVIATLKKGEVAMRTVSETIVQTTSEAELCLTCPIGEMPRYGRPVKDKNGADVYMYPADDPQAPHFKVASFDVATGSALWKEVGGLTVERDVQCVKVKTQSKEVTVSDNESLAVFDHEAGTIRKVAPKGMEEAWVPVNRTYPALSEEEYDITNTDMGWLLGAMISDGWVSDKYVGYAKKSESMRKRVESLCRQYITPNFLCKTYADDGTLEKKYGASVKIHMWGEELHQWFADVDMYAGKPVAGERACLYKQISPLFIDRGSRQFLLSLLAGFTDGDGSLSKNTSMKNPRYGMRLSTSSPYLRDTYRLLLHRLGIRSSVTTSPPRNSSREAYVVMPSTIDMYKHLADLRPYLHEPRNIQLVEEWLEHPPGTKHAKDTIPVTQKEVIQLREFFKALNSNSKAYARCMKHKYPSVGYGALEFLAEEGTEEMQRFASNILRRGEEVYWERIKTVEDAGVYDVFDLLVEGTKVFAVNGGLIIYDTMSYSVPVSEAAVEEAKAKMLPERLLLSERFDQAQFIPSNEYVKGLYLATKPPTQKPVKRFPDRAAAFKAYRQGEIAVDDPIIITD